MSDDLIEELWASDEASFLTNQAARRIEALEAENARLREDENPRSTKEPFSEYGHYGENNPPVGMSSPGDKDYEV